MQDVLSRGLVDEILVVPNYAPPYSRPEAPLADLRAMAALATEGMAQVSVADEALLRTAEDSVGILKAVMRGYPGALFSYIIGADKLAGILHWRKADRIFELMDVIVCPRVGYSAQELTLFALSHGIRAKLLSAAPIQPSSGLVRTQLRLLSDAPDMLDPRIAYYIARKGLYLPPYEDQVRPMMSPGRFAHTLGVRSLAVDLAHRHRAGRVKAAVAALLHDCAKGMKLSQLQAVARQYGLTEDPQVLQSNALLHGRVGATLAQLRFRVQDEDVLNAIRYHTTGRRHMSPLELCLYVADAAELGRSDYPGLSEVRSLMWADLRRAALLSMTGTFRHVQAMGQEPSLLTQDAIDDLTRSIAHSKAG